MPFRKSPHAATIAQQPAKPAFGDEDRRAPISAERLKQAREAAGLTLRELAGRLPGGDVGLTHGRLSQIEKAGGMHRTSVAAVKALARALHVQVAWLSGEPGAFPIPGFRLPPLPSGRPDPGLIGSDLRRALFTNRCLKAARREWLREGRKAEGAEWLRTRWWLLYRFWLLPERAEYAVGLVPLPLFHLTASSPEGSRQRPEPWTEAAVGYWSVVLEPWWEGRVELDWRALARLPSEPQADEPSSLRDVLELAQRGWRLPAALTGLPVDLATPPSAEEIERQEATQQAEALPLIKEALRHPEPIAEDQLRGFRAPPRSAAMNGRRRRDSSAPRGSESP